MNHEDTKARRGRSGADAGNIEHGKSRADERPAAAAHSACRARQARIQTRQSTAAAKTRKNPAATARTQQYSVPPVTRQTLDRERLAGLIWRTNGERPAQNQRGFSPGSRAVSDSGESLLSDTGAMPEKIQSTTVCTHSSPFVCKPAAAAGAGLADAEKRSARVSRRAAAIHGGFSPGSREASQRAGNCFGTPEVMPGKIQVTAACTHSSPFRWNIAAAAGAGSPGE
jgi:hypothetical protein